MMSVVRRIFGLGPPIIQSAPALEIQFEILTTSYGANGEMAKAPSKGHEGDAGWDLYVSRPVTIPPHTHINVHHDIAVRFPPGVWALITGRSSTLHKKSLMVTNGIIDNGYTGELFASVFNVGTDAVYLEAGDRIAQLIPMQLVPLQWYQVTTVHSRDGRGVRGFGSSGR